MARCRVIITRAIASPVLLASNPHSRWECRGFSTITGLVGFHPMESSPDLTSLSVMKTSIRRSALLTLLATMLIASVAGCRTAHGFGKDVEKAGEAIQDGTR